MSQDRRRHPNLRVQARVLDEQQYCCLYCTFPFGTLVRRRSTLELTRLEWDHFVPYSLAGRSPDDNWVAACHVCNHLKGDRVFDDVMGARDWVLVRWTEFHASAAWVPSISSEEDPDAWTLEYAEQAPKGIFDRDGDDTVIREKLKGFITCQGCGEDFKPRTRSQEGCSEGCSIVIKFRRSVAEQA